MLVEEKVLLMDKVGDLSLDQIKQNCFQHFSILLRQELLNPENTADKYGTIMYTNFCNWYGKKVSYNNKNLTYKELITTSDILNLYEFCGNYFGLEVKGLPTLQDLRNYTIPRNGCSKVRYYNDPKLREESALEKGQVLCKEEEEEKAKLANFNIFFGKGEFPFIYLKLIRLGNQDYYMYTIVR